MFLKKEQSFKTVEQYQSNTIQLEGEETGAEEIFEEITAQNFSNLMKDINLNPKTSVNLM